jgi:alpha-beta hydrolase superfamily lysophospholipase
MGITYHMLTIIMKQGVIGASKTPNKKRQIDKPAKFWQAAVIMRIAPQEMTQPDTTLAILVLCAKYDQGYSAAR